MVSKLIIVSLETVRIDNRIGRRHGAWRIDRALQGLACTLTAITVIFLFFCFPKTNLHYALSFALGKGTCVCMYVVRGTALIMLPSVFEHTHGLLQLTRRSPSLSRSRL
jgi:hypothetical protein